MTYTVCLCNSDQILSSVIDLSHVFLIVAQARTIFEKATKVNYKQVDDLAAVWCEYGEMELRHENYEQALRILRVRHLALTGAVSKHGSTVYPGLVVASSGCIEELQHHEQHCLPLIVS